VAVIVVALILGVYTQDQSAISMLVLEDPVQIRNAIGRLTPDDGLARFSDALGEFARRLDSEFRQTEEGLPPYLPVLVSIATTDADGSEVRREQNRRMLLSRERHRVWTHMIMVQPARGVNEPGRHHSTNGIPP
jgi:hypothetical protein